MSYILFVLLGIFCLSSAQILATLRQTPTQIGTSMVTLELTNSAPSSVALLRWFLPLDDRLGSDCFFVDLNGFPVSYIGPKVKYAGPFMDDYVYIAANETITVDVELQNLYDMSMPGTYDVLFMADILDFIPESEFSTLPRTAMYFSPYVAAVSNFIHITTTESLAPKTVKAPYPCSAGETNQINNAASSQRTMIGYAYTEINQGETPTYTEWFGAYSDQRYNSAQNTIRLIYQNTVVAYACDDRAGVYAYVYPADTTHTIYVCGAFWPAPVAGGWDTKAGTLIHELSHFNNIGGTNDWVYGVNGARNLALTNPTRAVNNADNHEYYAESLW